MNNLKVKVDGHVDEVIKIICGPPGYESIICQKDAYFQELLRYI